MLGESLFMSLGFDIYILQGKCWGEIDSIEELLVEFKMKCEKGDSYDVTKGNFGENTFNEVKLRE